MLHQTTDVERVDLRQCYDEVIHTVVCITMHSFKVRVVVVAMILSILQTMNFYLDMGFDQSSRSNGSTKEDPTMGLAQGIDAAPPIFLAISTLMIDSYKHLGHGMNFVSM